jgi:hypothetical protein
MDSVWKQEKLGARKMFEMPHALRAVPSIQSALYWAAAILLGWKKCFNLLIRTSFLPMPQSITI